MSKHPHRVGCPDPEVFADFLPGKVFFNLKDNPLSTERAGDRYPPGRTEKISGVWSSS
jgi:hypothetical protein